MPDDMPPLGERRDEPRLATEVCLEFIMEQSSRSWEAADKVRADPFPHFGAAGTLRACVDGLADVRAVGLGACAERHYLEGEIWRASFADKPVSCVTCSSSTMFVCMSGRPRRTERSGQRKRQAKRHHSGKRGNDEYEVKG